MKKCGAIPNVNTYVQLAHSLNSLYTREKQGTPPKSRRILSLIERLDAQNLPNWSEHKGIGVLFNILHATAINSNSNNPEDLPSILATAKLAWAKADPLGPKSRLSNDEKRFAITHFLNVLQLSQSQDDWRMAADMIPQLSSFHHIQSRRCALRVAQRFPQSILAKQYWKYFSELPFDQHASEKYLLILSKSANNAEEALEALAGVLENSKTGVASKSYIHALLACLKPPNIDVARKLYHQICKNEAISGDFGVHALLLDVFRFAIRYPHIVKTHSPDQVYSIIRELNFPKLLSRKDIDTQRRLDLLEKIEEILLWRIRHPGDGDKETKRKVMGDLKFAQRWREIIENEDNPNKGHDHVVRDLDSASSSDRKHAPKQTPITQQESISLRNTVSSDRVPDYSSQDAPRHKPHLVRSSTSRESQHGLGLEEENLELKSAANNKFTSRIANERRFRQPTPIPFRIDSRSFSTFSRHLRAELSKRPVMPHRSAGPGQRQKKRPDKSPVLDPSVAQQKWLGPPSSKSLPRLRNYVSASRENISIDPRRRPAAADEKLLKEIEMFRSKSINEKRWETNKGMIPQAFNEFWFQKDENSRSAKKDWVQAEYRKRTAGKGFQERELTVSRDVKKFSAYNSVGDETCDYAAATASTTDFTSRLDMGRTVNSAENFDPFTATFNPHEGRDELEERQSQMEGPIQKPTAVIRLPRIPVPPNTARSANKEIGDQIHPETAFKQHDIGYAETKFLKKEMVVIRLPKARAAAPKVELAQRRPNPIIRPPASLENSTPEPSIESCVDERARPVATNPNTPLDFGAQSTTSISKTSTDFENSTPKPSIKTSVNDNDPLFRTNSNEFQNSELTRELPSASTILSREFDSRPSHHRPRKPKVAMSPAVEERISMFFRRLKSAIADSEKTEEVSSSILEDRISDVMSMSAEDRILLMRGLKSPLDKKSGKAEGEPSKPETEADRLKTPAATKTTIGRGGKEGSVANESVGTVASITAVPKIDIDRPHEKRGQKANVWTPFKQKGWELVHKAETMRHVPSQ